MKSQTRWTSCEDPQPASPPCCLKYAASGLWSTCQKSWSNLTRQEDKYEQFTQQLANRLSTTNWTIFGAIHLYPHPIYLASRDKDKKSGQVRDSTLWKMCCNRSKIKLIFYSSRAVPLRKLFSRVVSKKVTKKHFLCSFSVQQCRIPQPINTQ